MAYLSDQPTEAGRDRGQIILVTAFALAVSFVALALVLNSVIYTENLATRSEAAKASDAVKVKADMTGSTAEIITYVNEYNVSGTGDYETLVEQVKVGVNNTTQYTRGYQIVNGQAVNATLVASDRGTWINQSFEKREFTDADVDGPSAGDNAQTNWNLVDASEGARRFKVNVTDPSYLTDTDPSGSANFTVIATDASGDVWSMEIAHNNNNGKYVVAYTDGNLNTGECVRSDSSTFFRVNVSKGTVEGTNCQGFWFGRNIGPVETIEYVHGDRIFGKYQVMVNKSYGTVPSTGNLNATGSSEGPVKDRAIYGGKILVEYEEQRMLYETDAHVIPGETDD